MSCNNADNESCCSCSCETNGVVPEFVPGKEYVVGEFFKINSEVFKVIPRIECCLCEFNLSDEYCNNFVCVSEDFHYREELQVIVYDSEE